MVNPEDRNMAKLLMTDPLGRHFTFDQTLDLAGYGRFHWMLLFGTGIGCISIMVEDNCMAFVLPMAKCELNLSTAEQGFMYVASTLGFVCSSHLWGFFADTWGRRQVLRTALLLCCITSAASSFALNSKMLMISRFTVGLCLSGIKGTSMSYLSEFHNTRMRPVHLSLLSSFIMSSAIFQPLIAMVFLQNSEYFTLYNSFVKVKSWRLFILVGSLVSGLGSLLIHWLPESPKFLLAMGKPKAAIKVLQNMYAVNTGIKRNVGKKCIFLMCNNWIVSDFSDRQYSSLNNNWDTVNLHKVLSIWNISYLGSNKATSDASQPIVLYAVLYLYIGDIFCDSRNVFMVSPNYEHILKCRN